MADIAQPAAAPVPANGVSITQPAATAAPIAAAPMAAPVMQQPETPKESFFKDFDWLKVIGYSVLIIVGVSYIKYTRERATKDATDIAALKSQLNNLTMEIDSLKPTAS